MINQHKSVLVASCLLVLGGCVSSPYGTSSRYGYRDRPHRDDRATGEREERGDRSRGELGRLAQELDSRASRAYRIAGGRSMETGRGEQEFYGKVHRFGDSVRQFHGQLESGELAGGRLRGAVQHLLDDAREADRSLRRARVSGDMLEEWQEIGRVLDRMLALVQG